MDNNTIMVTGIPKHLLKLLDERIRQKGGDRAGYIRQLIEKDITEFWNVCTRPTIARNRHKRKLSPV